MPPLMSAMFGFLCRIGARKEIELLGFFTCGIRPRYLDALVSTWVALDAKEKMKLTCTPMQAAVRLKRLSPLRPTLAIVLGSGFHHVADGTARGQKNFLRQNPRLSQTDRQRPRGRIVFRPSRQNAGAGLERARAFLRRPFDGARHVRRAHAGGVWHHAICC